MFKYLASDLDEDAIKMGVVAQWMAQCATNSTAKDATLSKSLASKDEKSVQTNLTLIESNSFCTPARKVIEHKSISSTTYDNSSECDRSKHYKLSQTISHRDLKLFAASDPTVLSQQIMDHHKEEPKQSANLLNVPKSKNIILSSRSSRYEKRTMPTEILITDDNTQEANISRPMLQHHHYPSSISNSLSRQSYSKGKDLQMRLSQLSSLPKLPSPDERFPVQIAQRTYQF